MVWSLYDRRFLSFTMQGLNVKPSYSTQRRPGNGMADNPIRAAGAAFLLPVAAFLPALLYAAGADLAWSAP